MTVSWPLFALACLGSVRDRTETVSLYLERSLSPLEYQQNDTGAKFEPAWGCYLGAYIDQDNTIERTFRDEVGRVHRLPVDFEQRVGKPHASYFFYMGYGLPLATEWVNKLGMQNKIVHIALEPNLGLHQVQDDQYLRDLADALSQTSAKVFLRFASEMNGTWVAYSKDPEQYREKFRLVARVMHERAPNVAMVWCPYANPTSTIPSYYPGDEAVDWVGVNMYSVTYYDQDPKRPAWKSDPCAMLDYVYDRYSPKKPIMIAEYGATHFSAVENEAKSEFAVRCIKSLYQALPRRYPRVKAINYFNANNLEMEHRRNNDYSLSTDKWVMSAYSRSIDTPYFRSVPAEETNLQLKVPMPLRDGNDVARLARVSAWVSCPGEGSKIRFLLDEKPVWASPNNGDWEAVLDFRSLAAGPHVLTVEAYAGSRPIGQKRVRLNVKN